MLHLIPPLWGHLSRAYPVAVPSAAKAVRLAGHGAHAPKSGVSRNRREPPLAQRSRRRQTRRHHRVTSKEFAMSTKTSWYSSICRLTPMKVSVYADFPWTNPYVVSRSGPTSDVQAPV